MTAINRVTDYLTEPVSNAALVTFRILFGSMMIGATLRFWSNGWISRQYLESALYFRYYGFGWIPHPTPDVLYAVFGFMILAALGIALGLFYRYSAALFFLLFTYVELLDKTYYLNHYYYIILVSFLLIWIPAHRRLSLDSFLGRTAHTVTAPRAYLSLLRFQVGLVYSFAGIAKVNYAWLIEAMPLRIWLAANANQPVLGPLFAKKATAYVFSWGGMLFDTLVPWMFLFRPTRLLAFTGVVLFHALTGWLFPIGMFPVVMIASTLVFFSAAWHERLIGWLEARFRDVRPALPAARLPSYWSVGMGAYLTFQIFFPLRHLLYPGDLFWTEQGYRFSWRVMLVEKMGSATFYLRDTLSGKRTLVYNREHLSPVQEKMMATQPDMILQYARYLKHYGESQGISAPEVTADIFVTLNGRRSRRFVDPNVDLASQRDGWSHKSWILSE